MAFPSGGFGAGGGGEPGEKKTGLFGQFGGSSLFGGKKTDVASKPEVLNQGGDIFKTIAKSGGFGALADFGAAKTQDKPVFSENNPFSKTIVPPTKNPFQAGKLFSNTQETGSRPKFGQSFGQNSANPFSWKKESTAGDKGTAGSSSTSISKADNPFASRKIVIESPSPEVKQAAPKFGLPDKPLPTNPFGNNARSIPPKEKIDMFSGSETSFPPPASSTAAKSSSPMRSHNQGESASRAGPVGEFNYRVDRPKLDASTRPPPIKIPQNIRSPPLSSTADRKPSRGSLQSPAAKITSKAVKTARARPSVRAKGSAQISPTGRVQRRRSSTTITDPEMLKSMTTLRIQGVPANFNSVVALRKHFRIFGAIRHATPRPRANEAFVEFENHDDAKKAKQAGTVMRPGTSPVRITWVIPKSLTAAEIPATSRRGDEKKAKPKKSPPKTERIRPLERENLQLKDYKPHKSERAPVPRMDTQEKPFSVPAGMNKKQMRAMLRELCGKHCPTTMDKYMLLENRDKILRKGRVKVSDVKHASVVVGECPDMCPEKERYQREVQKRLSSYEVDPDGKVIPELTVQDYSRSSADQDEPLPHELRPSHVLVMTMDYIFGNIANEPPEDESRVPIWYDFIWNRTRAIRKDITQQMLSDSVAVNMVEQCARFHIYAGHRLCEFDRGDFEQKFNTENLNKCLMTLKHFYQDSEKIGAECQNEAEFRAYDVLLDLNDPNILIEVLTYKQSVRQSPQVRLAVKLQTALQTQNYVRFFRLVRDKADFLQSCLIHRHFAQIRLDALHTIMNTYTSVPGFPVVELMMMLGFESPNECVEFCQFYGWNTVTTNGSLLRIDRTAFTQPESAYPPLKRSQSLVDIKATGFSLGELLTGGSIPPVQLNTAICSFDSNNNYTLDPVIEPYLDADHEHPIKEDTHPAPVTAAPFSGTSGGFGSVFSKTIGTAFGGPVTPSESKMTAFANEIVESLINEKIGQHLPRIASSERKLHQFVSGQLNRITQEFVRQICTKNHEEAVNKLRRERKEALRKIIEEIAQDVVSSATATFIPETVREIASREILVTKQAIRIEKTRQEVAEFADRTFSDLVFEEAEDVAESFYEENVLYPLKQLEVIRERLDRLWLLGFFRIWHQKTQKRLKRQKLLKEFPRSRSTASLEELARNMRPTHKSPGGSPFALNGRNIRDELENQRKRIADWVANSWEWPIEQRHGIETVRRLHESRKRMDLLNAKDFFNRWRTYSQRKRYRRSLIENFPTSPSVSLQEAAESLGPTPKRRRPSDGLSFGWTQPPSPPHSPSIFLPSPSLHSSRKRKSEAESTTIENSARIRSSETAMEPDPKIKFRASELELMLEDVQHDLAAELRGIAEDELRYQQLLNVDFTAA